MKDINAIREKIRHAEKLSSVVRSMKVLSRVSIHQFEKASESTELYRQTLQRAMHVFLREESKNEPLKMPYRTTGRAGFILLGAAHGLCGSFNEDLILFLQKYLHSHKIENPELLVMGHRISELLDETGNVEKEYEMPVSVEGITDAIIPLMGDLYEWMKEKKLGQIHLVHHIPEGRNKYRPDLISIIPADDHMLYDSENKQWPSHTIPQLLSDPRQFIEAWMHQYLHLMFFRSITLSLASEHSSRLMSMSLAENKITERIQELQRAYSKARQASVMAELLDILSGYEAVSGSRS